jgi:hypothetical protein
MKKTTSFSIVGFKALVAEHEYRRVAEFKKNNSQFFIDVFGFKSRREEGVLTWRGEGAEGDPCSDNGKTSVPTSGNLERSRSEFETHLD